MSQAAPKIIRDVAERLIAHENNLRHTPVISSPVVFDICEKMRPLLGTLMGKAGFYAVLSRALALASKEVAWLRTVQIKRDGTFQGLDMIEADLDVKEIAEGQTILLARLIGLLVAFIGENLTLRLVLELWPKLPLKNLNFGNGDNK